VDRKQRKQIVSRISDILENTCGHCEFNKKHNSSDSVCVTSCKTGKELQRLGSLLEKKEGKALSKITQEAYESMKNDGQNDTSIAKYFEITTATLSYHKKKWYGNSVEKKKKAPKKDVTPMSIPEVKVNPLVEENTALKAKVKELESYNQQLKEDYQGAFNIISDLRKQLAAEKNNEIKYENIKLHDEINDYQNLIQALKPFLTILL
jgi:hypothetical protein